MPFRTTQHCQEARRSLEACRRDGDEGRFYRMLEAGIEGGELTPNDFRLRHLFEHFVDDGREILMSWDMRDPEAGVNLRESGVNTGAFTTITRSLMSAQTLEAFNDPVFIAPRLARAVPTSLDGERIGGIGRLGDVVEIVREGDPYPTAGVAEEWVDTPRTTKRGVIVPVTKEAVFFDRTGLVLERCREVGQSLAINKEKRVVDAVLGVTNNYRPNGNAAIDTYGDNSGTHTWDNLCASNGLTDWTDFENALLLFDGMTDPNTGEPIVISATQVVVATAKVMTADRILNAVEYRHVSTHTTVSPNPLKRLGFAPEIVSNQYVGARMSAGSITNTTWYIGDFQGAFWYMENWPITVVEAPPNSEQEFTHDIVSRFKVSERGAIFAKEPRKVVKNTA